MKKLFLFLMLISIAGSAQTKVERSGTRMGYLLQLPLDYNPLISKKYPVIIFLHGSGEKGNGTTIALEKTKVNGIGKQIKNGAIFTFNGEQCIVVCPQTANKNWITKNKKGVPELEEFVQYIKATYNDDSTRYYLTGLSMGGQGTWQGSYLPHDYFAAILPVSGFCDIKMVDSITSKRHIAIWALHGGADKTIGQASGHAPIAELEKLNYEPAPLWTKDDGYGHNALFWDRVYDINQKTYPIYFWLLSHKSGGF